LDDKIIIENFKIEQEKTNNEKTEPSNGFKILKTIKRLKKISKKKDDPVYAEILLLTKMQDRLANN
jgi:hypothetical protein